MDTLINMYADGEMRKNIYKPNADKKVYQHYSNTYIQQDATLHSLFYLETALHVSGGTITHHQERKQLYVQHLVFVTPLLLPATIVEDRCILEYSYDARTHEC
jgi:hypothetical protein